MSLTPKDVEDIKKFDVVESCGTAGLVSSNVIITDVVNNVVLALK